MAKIPNVECKDILLKKSLKEVRYFLEGMEYDGEKGVIYFTKTYVKRLVALASALDANLNSDG